MNDKDKELLLKDLCSRLPYGVKVKTNNINILKLGTHTRVGEYVTDVIEPCKPYLFPLSSMTEEQREELKILLRPSVFKSLDEDDEVIKFPTLISANPSVVEIDYYNKNHFDYQGLIEKGLAIDATNLNIYIY